MDNFYYYQSFRKTTVQFLDLFSGIKIRRFDRSGNFLKFIKVPIKYSPKEKIFYWLNERHDDEMLPMMSCQLNGVDYSLERAANKHQRLTDSISTSAGVIRQYLNPVPYDVNFTVTLWSLYMYDIDQILEQILPWFQPYVMIRIYSPELVSTFDVKVIFSSVTPEIESEYADDAFRVLKYTLDFQVQTYMFKPMENTGIIRQILLNYYTSDESWAGRNEVGNSTFASAASGESQVFTAVDPWLTVDNDPIYDYELYSYGDKIGSSHVSGGTEHINHAGEWKH